MADIQKTVEIMFGGKNEVSKTIGVIEKDIGVMGSKIADVAAPLAAIGDSVLKLDAALLALAIGGMAYAIKTAGDFNGKFGEITTLLSDTGAPIERFKANIKGYAVDSVKSIDDINQAIYTAISAGVDYKDSIKFVNEAEKLSVAGRSALGDTTKVLISVLNAYGQSTDQAGKYSDIMFATVKLGLTTMSELSASLAQVTGLAANAGIPFTTLSAAIAALTTTGMPTAQAITSIKAAIQNIIKPTKDAEETSQSLGLQFNATALKTQGLEGVLWAAQKATGGNVETMAKLFGSVEALNAVMVLASDKTGKFKSSLEEIGKSAGATQVAYDKVANEFENINQRIANSFKITLVEIGEKMMPEYGKLAGSMANLMKGIKVGVDAGAFDPLFNELNRMGSRLSEYLVKIAEVLPEAMKGLDFSGLIESFGRLGDEIGDVFSTIFGDVDLTTAEGLRTAIQAVVDAFGKLIDFTGGMIRGMEPLWQSIKIGIDKLSDMDSKGVTLAGTIVGVGVVIDVLKNNVGLLTGALYALSAKALVDTTTLLAGLGSKALLAAGGLGSLTGVAGVAAQALGVGVAGAVGYGVGSLLNQIPVVEKVAQGFFKLIDVNDNFFGASGRTKAQMDETNKKFDEAVEKHKTLAGSIGTTGASSDALTGKVGVLRGGIEALPEEVATKFDINEAIKAAQEIAFFKEEIEGIPDAVKVPFEIDWGPGGSILEKVGKPIEGLWKQTLYDGTVMITDFGAKTGQAIEGGISNGTKAGLKTAKDKLKEEKDLRAQANIELKYDETKIKAQSDVIGKSIEWKAKVDIAEAEGAFKVLAETAKNVGTEIDSTGKTMGGLVESLLKAKSLGEKSDIERLIKKETERRDAAFQANQDLTNQTIQLNKERLKAYEKGQGMITVKADGLKPHLELILWEILDAIQVRANESGSEFLLGMK